jgi:hypothetical protein
MIDRASRAQSWTTVTIALGVAESVLALVGVSARTGSYGDQFAGQFQSIVSQSL